MGIKESPNRVVRTKDSVIAFIGHNQQANEDILIECMVDSASNEVSFKSMSKARYGKDFVEANEDVQPLIDFTNSLRAQQAAAANVPTVDEEGKPVQSEPQPHTLEPKWKRLGFASEEEWKQSKGK